MLATRIPWIGLLEASPSRCCNTGDPLSPATSDTREQARPNNAPSSEHRGSVGEYANAGGAVQILQTSATFIKPLHESDNTRDHSNRNRHPAGRQPLGAGCGPRAGSVGISLRPANAGLPLHGHVMHGRIYAGRIAHLDLTVREYTSFIESPFVDERIGGPSTVAAVAVRGEDTRLPAPGSLPVVVVWVGSEFGGDGPSHADVVVGENDVDEMLDRIVNAPLAARSLAVLLRSIEGVPVEAGLAMESAVYSTLQAGPEFAVWRSSASRSADTDDRVTVLLDRDVDDLVITLDRPARHNAISTRLRDELAAALAVPLSDHSIRSVFLRGNGPSFCSGGDLDEFGSRPDPATAHVTRLARSPARMIDALGDRITVDVDGATMGGGVEMAAFARRVRAAPDTRIALPEIGLGLIPGAGGTVSLSRRIGRQRTAALALSVQLPNPRRLTSGAP
jgi:Enoyl-CoA hydratase/isomerase